jgi:hypothetical protein
VSGPSITAAAGVAAKLLLSVGFAGLSLPPPPPQALNMVAKTMVMIMLVIRFMMSSVALCIPRFFAVTTLHCDFHSNSITYCN